MILKSLHPFGSVFVKGSSKEIYLKEVLEEALNNLITYGDCKDSLTKEEFYELGLGGEADSAVKRAKVAKAFHLGECNGKTMFKRINMLGISYNDIKEIL